MSAAVVEYIDPVTADFLMNALMPLDGDELSKFLASVGRSTKIEAMLRAALLTDLQSGETHTPKVALYIGYRLALLSQGKDL